MTIAAALRQRLGASVATIAAALGCASIPENRFTVARIAFTGNDAISSSDLEDRIVTRESPRFLGLFRGLVYDYETFNRFVLERDLERVQRYYRARGYYQAKVRAGRVYVDGRHVRIEIVVDEGAPVLVDRVDLHGLERLEPSVTFEAALAVRKLVTVGQPFDEEKFEQAQQELERALANRGYAYVAARRSAEVDLPRSLAAVGYWVSPGPPARYGPITIEGLGNIPRGPVERALDLTPGDPYSRSELIAAERAVLELGVFSSVRIETQVEEQRAGEQPELVPIRVVVEPTRPRSIYFGGGFQIDSIKTDAHLRVGWEHNNFLGGLRRFGIEAVPGLVFYPMRIPEFDPPERLLPELRVRTEFRQPSVIENRTNLLLRAQVDVYPVLFAGEAQGGDIPVLGYVETRAGVGLDRTLWRVYTALSQNLQQNVPFSYVGPLDPDLGPVLISYPEIALALDFRDRKLQPRDGFFVFGSFQVAGLGGDATDVKVQPDVRAYFPVGAEGFTLATRAQIGLLFPFNYGDTLVSNTQTGAPPPGVSRAEWVRDVQVTFLRGLFAGGPSSNRGYAWREIGPHGVVPFYNPGQTTAEIGDACTPGSPDFSTARCDLPLGGLTLWEASVELRHRISGPFHGAVFVDAADVSPEQLDFRLDHPHLSLGFGFRYDTPVGPIRFDLGYRLPGLQNGDSSDEGTPVETLGLPIALSFGIGEAF